MNKKIILILIMVVLLSSLVSAWYNPSWNYRKQITVTGDFNIGGVDQNVDKWFRVRTILDTSSLISAGKMNSDCSDVRITNSSEQDLNFAFLPSRCNQTDTEIVFESDRNINYSTTNSNFYIYYGNLSTTKTSDTNSFYVYDFGTDINQYFDFNNSSGSTCRTAMTVSYVSGGSGKSGYLNISDTTGGDYDCGMFPKPVADYNLVNKILKYGKDLYLSYDAVIFHSGNTSTACGVGSQSMSPYGFSLENATNLSDSSSLYTDNFDGILNKYYTSRTEGNGSSTYLDINFTSKVTYNGSTLTVKTYDSNSNTIHNSGTSGYRDAVPSFQFRNSCNNAAILTKIYQLKLFSSKQPTTNFGAEEVASGDLNILFPSSFSYLKGNKTIDLNVIDFKDSNLLGVKLAYSTTSGVFTNSIVDDTNLFNASGFTCMPDYNFKKYTKCSYDWDTSGVTDGNYYLDVNFYSTDANYSVVKSQYIGIDNSKSSTSWNKDTNSWYKVAQNVSLVCDDNVGSGCLLTQYRYKLLPSGSFNSWQSYTNPIVFDTEGKWHLDFNSSDNAGNVGDTNTKFLFLDKTKPTITSDVNSNWNLLGDANIHLTCIDALSDKNSVYFRVDDNNSSDLNWLPFSLYNDSNLLLGSYLNKFDGNFGLQFYCTDNAGNDSNIGTAYDTNYVLLEVNSPPTPTILTPTSGSFTGTVNVSCSAPSWIRDYNYSIDYNTTLLDWNNIANNSSGNTSLDINSFTSNTKMWFRCKTSDTDKNSAYKTNTTNILLNPDTGFDSISNATPLLPTIATSASLPFSVTATDSSGVSYCTFEIYKNSVYVIDVNGVAPNTDGNNGVWTYTYTSVSHGDIVFMYVSCKDKTNNTSAKISSSTYSVSITTVVEPPAGGGGSSTLPSFVTPSLVTLQASTLTLNVPSGTSKKIYSVLIHNLTSGKLIFGTVLRDGLDKYLLKTYVETPLNPGEYRLLTWEVSVAKDTNFASFDGYIEFNLNNGQEYVKQNLTLTNNVDWFGSVINALTSNAIIFSFNGINVTAFMIVIVVIIIGGIVFVNKKK